MALFRVVRLDLPSGLEDDALPITRQQSKITTFMMLQAYDTTIESWANVLTSASTRWFGFSQFECSIRCLV